jgi:hypothetical protein
VTDSPNYCQHSECHNSHIAYYADMYSTGTWLCPPQRDGTYMSFWPPSATQTNASVWRRWCRSHALINEGVSLG